MPKPKVADAPLDNPFPRPLGHTESLEQYQERVRRKLDCICALTFKILPKKIMPWSHAPACPMQIAREVWLAGPIRWKSTLNSLKELPYEAESASCG